MYRYFSTVTKSINTQIQPPVLSEVVKQLSKFSSHDELLEYSQRPISHCYGNRMIEACSPHHSTPISLINTAFDLHDQLLVRVAHCICHFQSLPFLPAANPTLLSVHERYLKLFEDLAHFPVIKTDTDEEKFFDLINMFASKNSDIIGQLSSGCREAQKYFKTYEIMREFLDNVLENRLGMRLLAEHYLELHKQQKKPSSNDHWRGAICMNFSPAKLVQECIDDVSSICFDTYSVVPHVQIEDYMNQSLPYFPNVVGYILRELLKNSMRAVVEYHKVSLGNMHNVKKHFEENREEPLCKVLITADPADEHFTIAVQDQGGGIEETNETIFRYMFTGK
jgi:pyruvate dehydrogenase kinase 2/3/4